MWFSKIHSVIQNLYRAKMQNLNDTKNIHVCRKLWSIPLTSVDFLTQQENLVTSLCLPRVSVYSADYQLVQWLCKRKIPNISPPSQTKRTYMYQDFKPGNLVHSNECFFSVYGMQKKNTNLQITFIMNTIYYLLLSWIWNARTFYFKYE